MKVSYDEGLASHVGSESCVGVREDSGEALTGESAGWVLSSEILNVRDADAVMSRGRQHRPIRHREGRSGPAESQTPGTHRSISRVRRSLLSEGVIIVRYADDFVAGLQHESDAVAFHEELRERFRKFNLELHAEKTRVIEFGRFAAERRERRGQGKPETFNFLGFTRACDKTRQGKFIVLRRTMAQRLRAKLKNLKEELRRRLHGPVREVGRWLGQVLTGHYRYYGVPRNYAMLDSFRQEVRYLWHRVLNRRSQTGNVTEARLKRIADIWLPTPRICQPYPERRLAVMIQGKSPVR